jgi:hypothetical protein
LFLNFLPLLNLSFKIISNLKNTKVNRISLTVIPLFSTSSFKALFKTKRRAFAIFLFAIYFLSLVIFIFSIRGLASDVLSASEERSYLFPINLNLNGTMRLGEPDITFCLNFTYPKGTLVVDEPLDIIGLSVLRGKAMDDVNMTLLTFQNCLRAESYDVFHFPKQAFLVFNNSDHNRALTFDDSGKTAYILCDDTEAYWSMDGDYKPIISIFYANNTNRMMVIDDVTIHVYPREQLTQMQSNSINLLLSIAGFILGFVVVIDLCNNLWNYEAESCRYAKRNGWATLRSKYQNLKKVNNKKNSG